MKKRPLLFSFLALALFFSLFLLFCTFCAPGEAPPFDYKTSDLSPYIDMGGRDFRDLTVTLPAIPAVTNDAVKERLTGYLTESNGPYLRPTADATATVKEGDTLYLLYTGILRSVLDAAVETGRIPDALCTGMRYGEILDLSLGFPGGTTGSLLGLKIGAANYIAGFESGLVGALPSAHGEEDPVRLSLSFPASYSNADLAGKEVVFFCRLFYIGDPSLGSLTADTVSVEQLNAVLGLRGEDAYPTVDACLLSLREGMEREREEKLYSAKLEAVYAALCEQAVFPSLPEQALEDYVRGFLDSQLAGMQSLYAESPSYYAYLFGNRPPSEKLVATYYGYSENGYFEEMKRDAEPAIKEELVFWDLCRRGGYALSEEDIARSREKYTALYGPDVFDGVEEAVIYDQFLRDHVHETMLAYLEENGRFLYE